MSTITCSNFFPKVHLSAYGEGRYLLTGHGPFLELYDLANLLSEDFNELEYEPIRTHVFENSHVHCYTVFNDAGHVLALSSDFSKKFSVKACLVHRDQLLIGGYADRSCTYSLIEEPSWGSYISVEKFRTQLVMTGKKGLFLMAAIPSTTEIIILTESTITHFRYTFKDDLEVVYDIVTEVALKSILPSKYAHRPIIPLAIGDSSEYSVVISADETIVLLKFKGNKWICRTSHDEKRKVQGTEKAMMVPGKEIAVVGGDNYTLFMSTRFRQNGVGKDQLRILHEQYEDNKTNSTRTLTSTERDGVIYVYVLRENDLKVWKIDGKDNVSHDRTFEYYTENIAWRMGGRLQLNESSVKRRENKLINPATVHYFPKSAIITKRSEYSTHDLLVISCESGLVKVLRTEDILKNPVCQYSPSRNMENLLCGASLFQPDTVVRLVPHCLTLSSERKSTAIASVISTYSATIEIRDLSGKGRMKLKKEIAVMSSDHRPLFITSFNTYYVHSLNILYILAGSSTGEWIIAKWDSETIEQNNGERLESPIREVFFFGKEHATEPPKLFALSNDSELMVFSFDLESKSRTMICRMPLRTDERYDLPFVICNGDCKDIHDIWTINGYGAILNPGRKSLFDAKNTLSREFSSWTGNVESALLLTTRTKDASGMYTDAIFVVKRTSRLEILATVQEFGEIPKDIMFSEYCKSKPKSTSIALYGEFLDASFQDPERIEINIRLFIARRKSIKISLIKLSIESGVLKVAKNVKLGIIPTTIIEPSHIVVTKCEERKDRSKPKYAIISGTEGTETVRICAMKMEMRSMKSG